MKRTLFLLAVLAPVATLIGLLWDSGWGRFGGGPSIAQRAARPGPADAPSSRANVISLADGSGSDLFIQRDAEATFGGEPVRYPRSFSYARSWTNAAQGVILAEQPVVLFNAAPRNEHDLARLVRIDTTLGSAAAGRALLAAFGAASGIRSDQARISGDSELSTLSRVEFRGNVQAVFLDPEVEGDRVTLLTETLALDYVNNNVSAVRTNDAFTITRTSAGDFQLTGRGLEVLLEQNRATVFHDVRIEAILPERLGAARAPVIATAPGPLEVTMGKGKKPGTFGGLAGAKVVAGGGISFSQGDLYGSGRQVTASWDDAARISSVDLVDDVRIVSAQGTLSGTRLLMTPRDEAVSVRIEGRPVTVQLDQRGSFVPGQLGKDVTMTTPGVITISPLKSQKAGGAKERTIDVGPEVVIAGSDGRIAAARIVATIAEPDQRGERPFRVDLARVDAHDQETDLVTERMTIVRDSRASTFDDVITIPAKYEITRRAKKKAAPPPDGPPSRPTTRRDVPAFADGPMTLRGAGGLEITRPVLDDRPIVIVANDRFQIEAIDEKTAKPSGSLEAKRGRLVIATATAAATAGGVPGREIDSFEAEGRVRIVLPERALATGEKLTYDARIRQVTLVGAGEKDVAKVERTTPGSRDKLAAGTINFQMDLFRLVATQGVVAEMSMAPLPWIGAPKKSELSAAGKSGLIPTTMFAQRLIVSFDADKFRAGQMIATDVLAEIAVKVLQPGHVLSADNARFDPTHKTGIFRGSPLKYDVVRVVEGESLSEGLVCPMVVMDGDRVLVEGPATAMLHSKPGLASPFADPKDAARNKAASRPEAATSEPLNLRCSKSALLTRDFVRVDGRAVMEHGAPGAKQTVASADSVMLFLEKDPAQPSADPDFALAVMHGHAKLTAPELEASSDVMKINRVTKHMELINERPEKVTVVMRRQVYGSEVVSGAARIHIDFTKPGEPVVTADQLDLQTEVEERSKPDTRSRPR